MLLHRQLVEENVMLRTQAQTSTHAFSQTPRENVANCYTNFSNWITLNVFANVEAVDEGRARCGRE